MTRIKMPVQFLCRWSLVANVLINSVGFLSVGDQRLAIALFLETAAIGVPATTYFYKRGKGLPAAFYSVSTHEKDKHDAELVDFGVVFVTIFFTIFNVYMWTSKGLASA